MPWTNPTTRTVGEVITAAKWNTDLTDNLNAIRSVESTYHVGTSPFERWYPLGIQDTVGPGTSAPTANVLRAWPFVAARATGIDRLSINVTTLGTGSKARVGIYQATSATNIYPLTLIVDGGEFDTATTGVKTATVAVTLTAQTLYYAVHVCSATVPTIRSYLATQGFPVCGAATTMGGANIEVGFEPAFTYAALPATYPTGAAPSSFGIPYVAARYSA